MDHEEIFALIKASPITCPEDFKKIPGYQESVDFSEGTGRKFAIAYTDYSFSKSDETKCGILGCKQTHQNGWLVASSDDLITNIGKDCGKKHLDLEFNKVQAAFKERRRLESNNETIARIRAELEQESSRVNRIVEIGHALSTCAFLFKKELSDVSDRVAGMAKRRNATITAPKALTGRDAELYFELHRLRRSDFPGGIPVVEVPVGSLDGIAFFRDQLSVVVMSSLVRPISEIQGFSEEQIASMSPQRLDKLSRMSQDAIRAIGPAEQYIEEGVKFFSPKNIEKLSLLGADGTSQKKLLDRIKEQLLPLID